LSYSRTFDYEMGLMVASSDQESLEAENYSSNKD